MSAAGGCWSAVSRNSPRNPGLRNRSFDLRAAGGYSLRLRLPAKGYRLPERLVSVRDADLTDCGTRERSIRI